MPRSTSTLRLPEDDARRLLLVRAVELGDAGETLLTREDRQQAEFAGARQGETERRFVAARSAFAFGRLATRFPAVARAQAASTWPGWVNWLVPAGALLLGLATNEIGGGKRLNLIAFPLLGMIAWNLFVYLLLLAGLLRRGHREPGLVSRWLSGRAARPGAAQAGLNQALQRFAADWLRFAAPLTNARVARVLHLAAAAFAVGVILGMYARALGVEYRAGWESTFMGAGTVHALVSAVLTPASVLTGIALPSPAELAALRWDELGRGGENAGPWINLYAVTAALLILVPRLLLAAASAAKAARLARALPVPGREDFYVRRLLRGREGGDSVLRVQPYAYRLGSDAQRRLHALLTAAMGAKARVVIADTVGYGAEDEWLASGGGADDADTLVVLFNMATTPEAENHGAFVAGLRQQAGAGVALAVLVDEGPFRERAVSEERVAARRRAWEHMLGERGVAAQFVDLAQDQGGAVAQRLEAALVATPDLLPAERSR